MMRDAMLSLNNLDSVSGVLEDFMQLCYTTAATTAKVIFLPGTPFIPVSYTVQSAEPHRQEGSVLFAQPAENTHAEAT